MNSLQQAESCTALRVTVSVVSHGQGLLAQRVLDDITRHGAGLVTKVVVTQNIPEAWDPRIEAPGIALDIRRNRNPLGYGANHNRAFGHCDTAVFAVLNPDLRLNADTLPGVVRELSARPLGLVTPRVLGPAGGPEDYARDLPTPWRLLLHRRGRGRLREDRPEWLAGMFMAFRAEAFRAVGGFDERFFMYCEDTDICARLRLAGWPHAIAATVSVVHEAQRASHRSLRHLRWHVASLARLWTSAAFWRYRALLARERAQPPLA